MRPDRLLLQDMLDAIEEIIETTPPDRETYDANKLLRSHLVRNIQIIGEAAVRDVPPLKPLIAAIVAESLKNEP